MEIFQGGSKYPKEWSLSFTDMKDYAPLAGDFVYVDKRINFKALKPLLEKGKKIVYADMEEPNRFFVSDPEFRREKYEYDFYKILTACPFTAEWLNKKQGEERRIPVYTPTDPSTEPPRTEKKYDVMFCGSIFSDWQFRDIKTISKFNYRYVAQSGVLHHRWLSRLKIVSKLRRKFPNRIILEGSAKYLTNRNVTHAEKLKLISQSKIYLTHNVLMCTLEGLSNVRKTEGWQDNKAFKELPRPGKFDVFKRIINTLRGKTYLVPQMKGRAFEAAMCRSLILCRRDPFNIIERFFVPDKEFVYYEPGKLAEKIKEILADYHKYEPIIENAYNKFMAEYTTKRYFEKFLRNLK